MKKKILYVLILVLLLVPLAGCGKKGTKLENGQEAVVTFKEDSGVNAISAEDLYERMKKNYGVYTVINMVDNELLAKEIEGGDAQTKYVNNQIQEWLNTFGNESTLLQVASQQLGINTMDELKEYVANTYKQEQLTLRYVKNDIVAEKEVKNYYDQKVFGELELKLILIDVDVDEDIPDEEKAVQEEEALKKAKEAIEKLNNGTSFEDVQKEYNKDDATKDSTVTIKWNDEFDSSVLEAANKLENEKYTTSPVKSSYGYYIIYKVGQKEKPSMDEVNDEIREDLANGIIDEDKDGINNVKALIQMREKYGFEIKDEEVKSSYDIYTRNQLNPSKSK